MADAKIDRANFATDFLKGDWDKAQYVEDSNVDKLLSVVVSLGAELWAVRHRQMTVEALLNKNNLVTAAAIESYQPTAAERVAWQAERDDTIERIYAVLHQTTKRVAGEPPKKDKVAPLKE